MKTRIKLFIILITATAVTIFITPKNPIVHAQLYNEIFSIDLIDISYFEDCYGNNPHYGFAAQLTLNNPLELESVSITDPNGLFYTPEEMFFEEDYLVISTGLTATEKPVGYFEVSVTNLNGNSATEAFYVNENDISSATPEITSPYQGERLKDETPLIEWLPFVSPEKDPMEESRMVVEVHGEGVEWIVTLPDYATSAVYNFDGSAPFDALPPGDYALYVWSADDVNEHQSRSSTRSCEFTVFEGRDIFKGGTGERLFIPGGEGEMTHTANTPFFIAHGWSFDLQAGEGTYITNSTLNVFVDGIFIEPDKILQVYIKDFSDPGEDRLVKYYLYNFPEGKTGAHLIEIEYWLACERVNTVCVDPKEPFLYHLKSWLVTFE